MHCRPLVNADGNIYGFACGRGPKRCKCGRKSTKICDHQLTGKLAGKTCDAPLCDNCATPVGKDRDLCPVHARAAQKDSVRP